jgi:hypothetical protein
VALVSPRRHGCAVLIPTEPDRQLAPCPVPPAWRATWRTKTGTPRRVLVCEDHRDTLDLTDLELLGCE